MNKKPTRDMFIDDDDIVSPEHESTKEDNEIDTTAEYGMVVELPSKGRFGYPSTVTYRDMLVRDEEILASATESTYTRVLNGVLKSILNECDFYEKLTLHDRDYLIVWVWSNNFSPTKKVEVVCRHCKEKSEHLIDFTKLDVSEVKENIKNPLEITLGDGKKIMVRMITVKDELMVDNYLRTLPEGEDAPSNEFLLAVASIDVGVRMPFSKKIEWVRDNIRSTDLGYVKSYHRYFKYGIPGMVDFECPACKEVTKIVLPFQAEDILFPTVSADIEEFL